MNQKEFGKYFALIRKKSGYKSQRQLASVSKVNNATIARIEDGSQKAKPETLKVLSQYLNTSYETLMEKAGYLDHLNYHEKEDFFAKGDLSGFIQIQIENYLEILSSNKKFTSTVKIDLVKVLKEFNINYESEITPEFVIKVSNESENLNFKTQIYEVLHQLVKSQGLLDKVNQLDETKKSSQIFNNRYSGEDLFSILHFINTEQNSTDYVIIETSILKNRPAFAVKVKDDSMVNEGLTAGDIAICVNQKFTTATDISVVLYFNEILLRKIQFYENLCILTPSNPQVPPKIIEDIDNLEIIGKVIQVRRNFE